MLCVLADAQNQADGGGLAFHLFVFFQVAQVKLHLAFVGGFKLAHFKFDGYQSAQAAMVKQQVDVVVAVVDCDALLPGKKSKITAQLDDEALHFSNNGRLKVTLRITV